MENKEFIEEFHELMKKHEIDNYSLSFIKEGMVQHSQLYQNGMQMVGMLEHGKRIIMKKLEGGKNDE